MAGDELGQGYVIVLEKGRPIGILTEKDLVTKILAVVKTRKTKVADIMTSPLITIDPDEDLVKASKLMRVNNIRRLPVVREEIIYGILTARDMVNKFGMYVDKCTRDCIRSTSLILGMDNGET